MSSVSVDNSSAISHSSKEEGWDGEEPCSNVGDTGRSEYLDGKCLDSADAPEHQGDIMPDDDYLGMQGAVGKRRCESFMADIHIHGGQGADALTNRHSYSAQPPVSQNEKSGETAWTDDMHRLYLNSIEEAFVKSLYDGAYHCYYCYYYCTPSATWPADNVDSVYNRGFYEEEVESTLCEPEGQVGGVTLILRATQNYPKRPRSEEKCRTKQTIPKGKKKRWKCGRGRASEEEELNINDAISTSNIRQGISNDQCTTHSGDTSGQNLILRTEEDQVIPSIGEIPNVA